LFIELLITDELVGIGKTDGGIAERQGVGFNRIVVSCLDIGGNAELVFAQVLPIGEPFLRIFLVEADGAVLEQKLARPAREPETSRARRAPAYVADRRS